MNKRWCVSYIIVVLKSDVLDREDVVRMRSEIRARDDPECALSNVLKIYQVTGVDHFLSSIRKDKRRLDIWNPPICTALLFVRLLNGDLQLKDQ